MPTLLLLLTLLTGFLSYCSAPGGHANEVPIAPQQQEQETTPKANDECDFSAFKPVIVSHFLQTSLKMKVKPLYPKEAVQKGLQGKISVKILVNRDGDVIKACALNGDELLRRAAEDAALKWKFKRNVIAGRESFVVTGIAFNFVLDKNDQADADAVRP